MIGKVFMIRGLGQEMLQVISGIFDQVSDYVANDHVFFTMVDGQLPGSQH